MFQVKPYLAMHGNGALVEGIAPGWMVMMVSRQI